MQIHTSYCPYRDVRSLPYFETVHWEVRGAGYEIILRIRATIIRENTVFFRRFHASERELAVIYMSPEMKQQKCQQRKRMKQKDDVCFVD